MKEKSDCFYDFGSFRLNLLKRQLFCNRELLPLTPKALTILLILIEKRGEVVAKEELVNAVWPDTAVEENNLTQQISTLRKVLGDQTRAPQFILTIPGQGYSFIATVEESVDFDSAIVALETNQTNDSAESIDSPKIQRNENNFRALVRRFLQPVQFRTPAFLILFLLVFALPIFFFADLRNLKQPAICVLPFRSLNNNEKSNLYSAGIPSYVTAKIGNLPNLIVRPVGSSEKYYGQEQNVVEVGRNNNVDAVLTGSTLCEGESIQIIVHLWDVKNNRQIWAKVFTRKASDTLNVQETISEEIVAALRRTELAN